MWWMIDWQGTDKDAFVSAVVEVVTDSILIVFRAEAGPPPPLPFFQRSIMRILPHQIWELARNVGNNERWED